MSYYSYNGWSASPSSSTIGIEKYRIPGTSEYIWLRRSAAPILLYVMDQWNRTIEPIQGRILDEWGWNFRQTRGGGSLSNHASGTAVDINATRYPRGRANMSWTKILKVRALIRKVNRAAGKTLLKWGGEWSGAYKDQMHVELAEGTNATDVQRAMRALSDKPNIWLDSVQKAMAATTPAGKGKFPVSLSRLQNRLVATGHLKGPYAKGYAGKKTRDAYRSFEKARGHEPKLTITEGELKTLSGGVYEIV